MKPEKRGVLESYEVAIKAKIFFGDQFIVFELRFLVYVDYCLKNGGSYNSRSCTFDELRLLVEWCDKGWLGSDNGEKIWCKSKEFYNIMCEILWDAYVVHE